MKDYIEIKNARTHNLKNISLKIPLNKITSLIGPSGSGKTSLAVHTLYAESRRRFINSMPGNSKFFWQIPSQIEVDSITPILPTWCLLQHNPIVGSRLNVLDLLGLRENLEKIFFGLGKLFCPSHGKELDNNNLSGLLLSLCQKYSKKKAYFFIEDSISLKEQSEKLQAIYFLDLKHFERSTIKSNFEEFFKCSLDDNVLIKERLFPLLPKGRAAQIKILVEGEVLDFNFSTQTRCNICDFQSNLKLESWHDLSSFKASSACKACQGYGMILLYDRKKLVKDENLSLREGAVNFLSYKPFAHFYPEMLKIFKKNNLDLNIPFSKLPERKWDLLYNEVSSYPGFNQLFSYLESKKYKKNVRIYLRSLQTEVLCHDCEGARVDKKLEVLAINNNLGGTTQFVHALRMDILQLEAALISLNISSQHPLYKLLNATLQVIRAAKEFNLGNLQLSRKAKTLSSGEHQKVLLLKYLSHEGSGSLFILDEPSLGLSVREQNVLLKNLQKLKDQKNTIIMIEHNQEMQKKSDYIIEFGPKAGHLGGEIIYSGEFKEKIIKMKIEKETRKREVLFSLEEAKILTLIRDKVLIHKNLLHQIKGDSGSGRSLLYIHLIYPLISKHLGKANQTIFPYEVKDYYIDPSLKNVEVFTNEISSGTSRSTFGTYTEIGKLLRTYYSRLLVSKVLNLQEGHFSANSVLGQCLTCGGSGVKTIEMTLLENVDLDCEDCHGQKIKPLYANISDGEYSFFEAVKEPISKLKDKIILTPKYKRLYQYIELLKLDYLSLDRKVSSLSGGEIQRLKLLSFLMAAKEESLLIFKNLSYGLSHHELLDLFHFLRALNKQHFTIVVIDNNELLSNFAHEISDFSST